MAEAIEARAASRPVTRAVASMAAAARRSASRSASDASRSRDDRSSANLLGRLGQPGERGGDALGREVDVVPRVSGRDALAGGRQRGRAGRLELGLELRARGGGVRGLVVGLLAGERAGTGLGHGPFEPLLQVREVAGGARLLGREVAALALERGAARGEVDGRPLVGFEQGVVARDRGFERGRAPRAARRGPRRPLRPPGGRPRASASARPRAAAASASRSRRSSRSRSAAVRASRRASARARVSEARRSLSCSDCSLYRAARDACRFNEVTLRSISRDDVGQPQEIAARLLELSLRQALLELVLRDSRGFFDQAPPVLGLGREHLVDAALLDDRVRAHAEAGAEELVLDVAQADLLVVQEVLALAVAVDAPADAQLSLGVALLAVAVGGRERQR